MLSIQVALGFAVGIFVGMVLLLALVKRRGPVGVLRMIEDEEENTITYSLELEEEPGVLLTRRYIFFKVLKKSH